MVNLQTRHILAGALALAFCARSPRARAQLLPIPIPVIDGSRFEQMRQMLQDIALLTGRIQAATTHLQNAAVSLGGGDLVDDILLGERRLTADLQTIGYSIETISTQFRTVFPTPEAAANVAPADVQTLQTGWDQEIQQSTLAAARAQTALSRVEANTQATLTILERSQAATGGASDEGSELAKLQALVQLLGVINSDLTSLATAIAATDRVNADVTAASASDEALEEAKAQRMMRDYARPEPIPDVHPDFLSGGASR